MNIKGVLTYLIYAVYVDMVGLGVMWLAHIFLIVGSGLYAELIPMIVIGLHFPGALAILDLLTFYSEHGGTEKRPGTSEAVRWLFQCINAIVTDVVGLIYLVVTRAEAFDPVFPELGTSLVVFFSLLLASTVIMGAAALIVVTWHTCCHGRRPRGFHHYHHHHAPGDTAVERHILGGLRQPDADSHSV